MRTCGFISIALISLAGCGGGSAGPAVGTPTPPPPTVTSPDFSEIGPTFERSPIANGAVLIGDSTGVLYRYEKGTFDLDAPINVASAAKLVSGLGLYSLIEDGTLSRDSRPADFITGWPTDGSEAITLSQLGAFTSGFSATPTTSDCHGLPRYSLSECVDIILARGADFVPGRAFVYGPDHFTIATKMAKEASGQELSETVQTAIFSAADVSAETEYSTVSGDNIRYSGGATGLKATTEDYAKILTALLAGQLITDIDDWSRDGTVDVAFASRFPSLVELNLDWHYGFGFFIECDAFPFSEDCANAPTLSSPGGRGFLPWIDLDAGYWAIIAVDEPNRDTPALESIRLEQTLQPLIEAALD